MKNSTSPDVGHRPALRAIAFATILSCYVVSAAALEVPLLGTGVSVTGEKLAPGTVDPHWIVVSGPGVSAPADAFVVNNQHPLGFYFTSPDSMWIWANASASAVAGIPYTFELSFDLTGYDPSTASLSGFWGVDNRGSVLLNGAPAVGTGTLALNTVSTDTFNLSYSFAVTSGFVAGFNQLQFQVTDAGNPAALNVGRITLVAAPVPEPSTLALIAAGALALLATIRRPRAARQ